MRLCAVRLLLILCLGSLAVGFAPAMEGNAAAPANTDTASADPPSGGSTAPAAGSPALIPWGRDRGISLGGNYIGEILGNVYGGLHTGAAYDGLLQINLDVDLEKLVGWSGAALHSSIIDPHGPSLSQRYVGDFSSISSIAAYDSLRLYSTWFEQSFLDKRVSVRVGLLAADEEFEVIPSSDVFINPSFGAAEVTNLGFPLASYPFCAPGVRLQVALASHWKLLLGGYDGNPAPGVIRDPTPGAGPSNEFNHWGTHFALRPDEGALLFAEVDWDNADDDEDCKDCAAPLHWALKLGASYHTDRFGDIHDVTMQALAAPSAPDRARSYQGNYAIYGICEHELYREPGSKRDGLTGFARLAFVPPDRNLLQSSLEAGLVYRGLVQSDARDALGLGFVWENTSARYSSAVQNARQGKGRDEVLFDCTYRCQCTPCWTVQPDLQWLLNTGGSSHSALVVGLRSTISF